MRLSLRTSDASLGARAVIKQRKLPPVPPPPIVLPTKQAHRPPIVVYWKWVWAAKLPGRAGQRFRVVSRDGPFRVLVEFDDGFRVLTDWRALGRPWEGPTPAAAPGAECAAATPVA